MNNCTDFTELISAYADGELSESDARKLEEHLSSCGHCSAFLDLYGEMAVAVTESCVPAPESLCGSVMAEIISGGVSIESGADGDRDGKDSTAAGSGGKRSAVRVILTRYVPIAACLALILLTIPRFISNSRSSKDIINENASLSSGAQAETGGSEAYSSDAVKTFGEADNGGYAQEPAGGAPAPSVAPAAPAPAPSPGAAVDLDAGRGEPDVPVDEEVVIELFEPDDAVDDSMLAEEFDDLPDIDGNDVLQAEQDDAEPEAAGSLVDENLSDNPAETPQPSPQAPSLPPSIQIPEGFNPDDWDFDWDRDGGGFLITGSIYAIIKIDGGLPEFFAMYGLDPIDDVDMYYEIPREYAELLIGFVRDLDGVTVTIVDEDGGYAVLIYTPAG